MRLLGTVPAEERPALGQEANRVKEAVARAIESRAYNFV